MNGPNKKAAREGLSAKGIVARENSSTLLADWLFVCLACIRVPRDQLIGPVRKLRQRRSHLSADSAPQVWRLFCLLLATLQAEEYKHQATERTFREKLPPSLFSAIRGEGENA